MIKQDLIRDFYRGKLFPQEMRFGFTNEVKQANKKLLEKRAILAENLDKFNQNLLEEIVECYNEYISEYTENVYITGFRN